MRNVQNIFDDERFFEAYQAIRRNPASYNSLLEQPALFRLLPELHGKAVLDLGCGAGEACLRYIDLGAIHVTGVDMSERMLALARRGARHDKIQYRQMDMCDIPQLGRRFDVVVSSLAVHYIADFAALLAAVRKCISPGGCFVFSQEHPFTTAPLPGPEFELDGTGDARYYKLSDYGRPGRRSSEWLVQNVVHYHRSFSQIIGSLLQAGFSVEAVEEPLPGEAELAQNSNMIKELHKPSFLVIRGRCASHE